MSRFATQLKMAEPFTPPASLELLRKVTHNIAMLCSVGNASTVLNALNVMLQSSESNAASLDEANVTFETYFSGAIYHVFKWLESLEDAA